MDRKLSRVSYLFWTKEKNAAGLESLVSATFRFETKVRQFCPFWMNISENNLLGKNTQLGLNVGLGKRASISSFGVEIDLTHNDHNKIFQLLTNDSLMNALKTIIRKYLGDFFFCYLCISPKKTPPLRLLSKTNDDNSDEKHAITNHLPLLGRTSWLQSSLLENHDTKIDCARVNVMS
jgi:predicted component of type VI protein secretion system